MIEKSMATMLSSLLLFNLLYSAGPERLTGPGRIKGMVIESITEQPIEYANVIVYDKRHRQITGTATDANGRFYLGGLNIGEYTVEISFIGFETQIETIDITEEKPEIDLGLIKLEQKPIYIEGTEVTAERPAIEFKIDKKVINVKEYYTSQSGTAVDVLQNIPSINVDVEGNVSLRGSTNFRVLIDNRPSILEPSDALQQIPASTIEKIEIITNPSARYEPDGIAGIINVITKKNIQSGLNGIANLSLGIGEKYSGDFLLNYRYKKFRAFLGVDYNNFNHPGNREELRQISISDTTFYDSLIGENTWMRKFYGIKTGLEYITSPKGKLGLNFELRRRGMANSSEVTHWKWTIPGDTSSYQSIGEGERGGYFYGFNADYLHNWSKSHKLSIRGTMHFRNGSDESTTELRDQNSIITNGWRTEESGSGVRLLLNLDYTKPFFKENKLESGYQLTVNNGE